MRFEDVEAFVIPFVKSKVGSVTVASKVPNPRPGTFVRAWVNGGAAINPVLERVVITVDCWAPSIVQASQLASAVREGFFRSTVHPLVRRVEEITRPYSQPDETSDRYRFSVALTIRATRH